jgi:hypothetical protein
LDGDHLYGWDVKIDLDVTSTEAKGKRTGPDRRLAQHSCRRRGDYLDFGGMAAKGIMPYLAALAWGGSDMSCCQLEMFAYGIYIILSHISPLKSRITNQLWLACTCIVNNSCWKTAD